MLKEIKRHFALRKARKRIMLMGQMIDAIDKAFTKKNVSRHDRRKFWHDFVTNVESRKKFVREMR